jgi:hypothetical protein
MSDCCIRNQRKEAVATVVSEQRGQQDSRCKACGTEGRPVLRQTVLHHVKHEHLSRVNGEAFRFCAEPNCDVVYYDDQQTHFTVAELRELVSAKTHGDNRPICYCFDFIEGDARKEIEYTGRTMIPLQISNLIKSGMCACEVRNPAGICCLGEVNRTVTRLIEKKE